MITLLAVALMAFSDGPSHVSVVRDNGTFHLTVNGKPFIVKGAGGDGDKTALVAIGANSFRTWGADNLESKLDEAQRLGLKVTIGIWLGHKEHGFRYDNPVDVSRQFEDAKKAILRYKDHPALLMWGLGNEMEGYQDGDDPLVWKAIEDIAHMAKQLDPNHPTMTVIAEIGGKKIPSIEKYCPSLDIVGINSYGGCTSIYERYTKQGATKPYILTEFGPPGTWETGQTPWKTPYELTSTEKEDWYTKAFSKNAVEHPGLCLGGYAFTWGNKQEATATWYGMLLPDGTKLGAVDAMQTLWSGVAPKNPCPRITKLSLKGVADVDPGGTVEAVLKVEDPSGDPLTVSWQLSRDGGVKGQNGDHEDAPEVMAGAITQAGKDGANLTMPKTPGAYRLFVIVKNKHAGAASGNIPLHVGAGSNVAFGSRVRLPFVLYSESGGNLPYTPSGWMGDAGAMKLKMDDGTRPHTGDTCIRWDYTTTQGWGGIAWQSPEGDWGDKPGGYDLTGAKKLVLYARGANGGEKFKYSLGLVKSDKKYFDTAIFEGAEAELTTKWTRYELDLSGQDMRRIKTGLVLTTAPRDRPETIYLDDIHIE